MANKDFEREQIQQPPVQGGRKNEEEVGEPVQLNEDMPKGKGKGEQGTPGMGQQGGQQQGGQQQGGQQQGGQQHGGQPGGPQHGGGTPSR